jgi:hypothetical protein
VCFVVLIVLGALLIKAGMRAPGPLAYSLGMRLAWDVSITLLGGVIVAWLLDAGLGVAHVAVLKLSAIAVARFTVWAIFGMPIRHVGGDMLGFAISFPLFVILFSYLFELDFRETTFAVVLITFMRWLSYFGMWQIL